jgi:hypothetical protein
MEIIKLQTQLLEIDPCVNQGQLMFVFKNINLQQQMTIKRIVWSQFN